MKQTQNDSMFCEIILRTKDVINYVNYYVTTQKSSYFISDFFIIVLQVSSFSNGL